MSIACTATSAKSFDIDAHHRLLAQVPERVAAFRGCIGLGLQIVGAHDDDYLMPHGSRQGTWIPNENLRWLTLVDVSHGGMRFARIVRWASLRQATIRFGVPVLTSSLMEGNLATPNQGVTPQLQAHFQALDRSMTLQAFRYRKAWRELSHLLDDDFLHDDNYEPPESWFPRAYIAVPVSLRPQVYDLATLKGQVFSEGLKSAFARALPSGLGYRAAFDGVVVSVQRIYEQDYPALEVGYRSAGGFTETVRFTTQADLRLGKGLCFEAGVLLATEPVGYFPHDWNRWPLVDQWNRARRLPRFKQLLRHWHDRQAVPLLPDSGCVHYPSQTTSLAMAKIDTVTELLCWKVGRALKSYYEETLDGCVFHPLTTPISHHLTGTLPGDVAYDFRPHDLRYRSHSQPLRAA